MTKSDIFECQYCKTEIKKGATICPNCKMDLRGFFSKHPIFTMFLIFIGLGMIGNSFTGNNQNASNSGNETTSGSCSSDMKIEVSNEYKSPSTVNFISCYWDKSKGIFGEADSQNGFGAIVRTSFLCNGNSCIITEKK
ncbi:MAG: hypothetical protein PHS49_00545 [Candidatus Gracilibacteria bacterium]|nr:hypothetical protein [Candidatus Gracilibacteria bacterium]